MQAVFRLTPIRLLTWLHWLRWGAIACVVLAVAVASTLSQISVDTDALLAVSAVVAAINALIGWSLRRARPATQAGKGRACAQLHECSHTCFAKQCFETKV